MSTASSSRATPQTEAALVGAREGCAAAVDLLSDLDAQLEDEGGALPAALVNALRMDLERFNQALLFHRRRLRATGRTTVPTGCASPCRDRRS